MSPAKTCCSADSEITVLFVRSKKRWQPTDFIHQVCKASDLKYLRHADVNLRDAQSPRKIKCYTEYTALPRVQRLLPQLEQGEFHAIVFEGVAAVDYCQDLCDEPPPRLCERYDFLGSSPSEFDALEDVFIFFNSVVSQPDCPLWILKLYCKHRPEDLPPSHRTTELKYGMREHELLSTMPSLGYRPNKRGSLQRASSYKRKSMMMLGTISGFLSNSKRRSTIVEIEPPSPVSDGDYCD
ncbi:hypothetical protein EV714DRAFT_282573 [Schizophyllum commune]